MSESHWIAEAIVDFLRGPLYINPLMEYIDEKCLIFTPEDENRLDYTQIHEEFKELVDKLLTDFLQELGVSPESFFEIVSSEQSKDKLTNFVVQTILTVDDFLMFKAMMVKRNIDLTNQVLNAFEDLSKAVGMDGTANIPANPKAAATGALEHEKELQAVLQMSQETNEQEARIQKLRALMRTLQLEDEDVALAIAIANSLRDQARFDQELAELEQAIALSLALEAEQRRLAVAVSKGEASEQADVVAKIGSGSGGSGSGAKAGATAKAIAAAGYAGHGPDDFGEFRTDEKSDKGAGLDGSLASSSGALRSISTTAAELDPLNPLNIGPNTAAEKMAQIAARAEANAKALAAVVSSGGDASMLLGGSGSGSSGNVVSKAGPEVLSDLTLPTQKLSKYVPELVDNEHTRKLGFGSSAERKVAPEPLNLPDKQKGSCEAIPNPDALKAGVGSVSSKEGAMNRAAGYKGGRESAGEKGLTAIRLAAAQAAATQKSMLAASRGGSAEDNAAQKWLNDQKLKLVAQKKLERQAEMEAYKAEAAKKAKATGAAAAAAHAAGADNIDEADLDAKRAALRDKLAQKFKQDIMKQTLAA